MRSIPIMRPKLPTAERLAPYLKSMDASRLYSNFGPLSLSFEDRLAAHYQLGPGTVATVANATLGLAMALAAQGAHAGTLCAMPAWTFVASAHAAVMAGLVPYFVDVDLETWALDTSTLRDALSQAPAPVGAVMPVAPFGRPLDIAAWDDFQSGTGIPVVIDAAAGFDALAPGATPAVVSLHATKVLGTGEGGFVISRDRSLIRAVRLRANFGFEGSREARVVATNAKFSEYHAAVGHAALDEWNETRVEWLAAAAAYRHALGDSRHISLQHGFGDTWVSSTCLLRFAEPVVDRIERILAGCRVETRRWWGMGAHIHAATASLPRAAAVPATEALAASTLAVPLYRDLGLPAIHRIVEVVARHAG